MIKTMNVMEIVSGTLKQTDMPPVTAFQTVLAGLNKNELMGLREDLLHTLDQVTEVLDHRLDQERWHRIEVMSR